MLTPMSAARSFRAAQLPRWLVLAVAFVFVFIAGLVIPYRRAVRVETRLATTTQALVLARLENTLAAAALEARRGRYENARQLTSDFFTRLQHAATHMQSDAQDDVRGVLALRDTTITLLSRGAPTSVDLLDRLIAAYDKAVRDAAAVPTRDGQ